MSDAAPKPGQFARRVRLLAALVVLVLAIASAAWFVAAHLYRGAVEGGRAELARQGIALECLNERLGGFPARFEWRCDSLAMRFANGAVLSGDALTTVAPVWNPLFTIAEWQGPFRTRTGDGIAAEVQAELARASLRVSLGGTLQRLSVALGELGVVLDGGTVPIVTAEGAEWHARAPESGGEASVGDLEVAALVLAAQSPLMMDAGGMNLSITGVANELARAQGTSFQALVRDWAGRSGRLAPLAVRWRLGAMAVNIDGEGQLLESGHISLNGTLTTNDLAGLLRLGGVQDGGASNALTAGASLFGQRTTLDDAPAISLPLVIERGVLRIGPVALAQLPPFNL